MPDFWIHSLAGQLVLEELKDLSWKEMIGENRKIYNLGCQGPDFFFYNDFLPCISKKRGPRIGSMLHDEKTKSLFLESINYLKKVQNHEDFPILASYFSGFVTHYVIDKHEHPFINARTKNFTEHKTLEIKLDTYFVKKYWNKRVHRLSPSSTIDLGKKLPPAIVRFYRDILDTTYGVSLEANTINDSYRDYKRVFNIFYSPRGYKRFFLNLLNAVMPIDISICIYPSDIDEDILTKEEFLEFENIFLQGTSEGIKLLGLIASYLKGETARHQLEAAFHDISFSGRPTCDSSDS